MTIKKEVLWFQISVYNVQGMEVIKRQGHFRGVKLCDRVGEALYSMNINLNGLHRELQQGPYLGFSQKAEKLSTFNKVHDHVQIFGVGESAPEGDEERMLDTGKHASLVVGMLHLLHLDDLCFLEDLDSVEALIVLGLDKMDPTETACS